MKIDCGHGAYLESDDEPRASAYHRRIAKVTPITSTSSGHRCVLECGHEVMTFGNLEHARIGDGIVVLCAQCREAQVPGAEVRG